MSSIDERVVNMKFNNSQFETGVAQTTKSLDSLKKGLQLDGATKGLEDLDAAGKKFSLAGMAQGIDTIASKFSALSIAGITALVNLTNKAVDAGLQFARSFTFQPIIDGLHEFETNMNSIQTVLANTSNKGTTLDDVNRALQELNTYSDKTIYNFTEMARNIGTFTAAGVDLNTSVSAIKGIANLAAVSGSSSEQASTAMYQLSQAIATGTVKLMDWNSVVNAGMGGQGFQEALKRTARVHGVAVDDMIKKNGSFRDSLQEGWLTAQILTETLSTYTGDLSAEQLKSMGYTDQQTQDILKMGKVAQDAATKVKTASQLMDTLKEAVGSGWTQTWQILIGNFDEAEKLFTGISDVLGKMVGDSANARNQLLQQWKDIGGRDTLIDALANGFKALMAIIKPVKDAFREIFPAPTAQQLLGITKALDAFTKSLIIGGKTSSELKRTFAGFFAIIDIGLQVLGQIVNMFLRLFGVATSGAGGILSITANIGDFFVAVDKAVKSGTGLTKFFDGLGKVLEVPITLVRALLGLIVALAESIGKLDFSGFQDAVGNVGQRMAGLADVGNLVAKAWNVAGDIIQKVWKFFQPVAQALGNFFSNLGHAIANSVKTGDFSGVLAVINTGFFGALVLLVKKFLKDGISVDLSGGLIDQIKGVFGALTDTLKVMQTQIKSKILINIAIAVGILTASLAALALIDPARLAVGLAALTVVFGELIGGMALLTKVIGSDAFASGKILAISAALNLLGTAMLAISGAVLIMSGMSWEGLAKGIVGLALALGIMVGAVTLLSLIPVPALLAASAALILISGALVIAATGLTILAGAMKIMGTLSWEAIGKGLTIMSAGLIILAVALTAMVASIPGALGLVVAAAGLTILATALKMMGGLSWETIGKGMTILSAGLLLLALGLTAMIASLPGATALVVAAAGLTILAAAMKSFGKLSWEDIGKGLTILSAGLLIMAVALTAMVASGPGALALTVAASALVVLGAALKIFGSLSWEDIGKALTILSAGLLIMAVALDAMLIALPGAVALTVAAAALTILTPVLIALSALSWEQISTGIGALAAVLGILAVAGVALIPAIPGLIGLGVAIALVGAGALAAGAGMLAFSIGLTALSVSGAAGAVAISAILQSIINLIPDFMTGLANGLIQFAAVLSGAAPTFIAAMTTLILSLLTAINQTAPQINATLWNLTTMWVNTIVAGVPFFVDAGMKIILGVINGVTKNLPSIIAAGTTLIITFIQGMQKSMNQIADAAMTAVVKFVQGLASSVRAHTSEMNAAGLSLATAIVDGMTGGLASKVGGLIKQASNMANSVINAAKNALGIHSPSREFYDIGAYSTEGLANGLEQTSRVSEQAAANVGTNTVMSLQKSIDGLGNKVALNMDFMSPVITPVLDLSQIKKDAATVPNLLPTPTLTLDKSYNAAVAAIQGSQDNVDAQNTGSEGDNGTTINFTQNNNSPKALSSADIYRQTKNQLSVVKGEIDKAS